jgi:ribosomal protein S18 acetylase RimI-like enzyme
MDLSFRPATEKDIPLIAALAYRIWHEHYPSIISVEQINYMLQNRYAASAIAEQMNNGERFFLAFAQDKPVAYASLELQGGHYYLHKFYIDVSKHRAGIGQQFFAYLLQQIDASKPIRLQVNRQNIKAVNFYFKMGFVIERAGDFHIGENYFMNDFVMVRKGNS